MITATRTFTTSDGVSLAFDDSGNGAGAGVPIILLHGWGQSRAMFREQVKGLAPSRRTITVDFRGHGESDAPAHGYRIARLAKDLEELIAHLALGRVDLLGWSMGASVIWSYLDLFGEAVVRSTVFVDQPSLVLSTPWLSSDEAIRSGAVLDSPGLFDLADRIRSDRSGAVVRDFVRGMFGSEPRPELWRFVQNEIAALPPEHAAALLVDHATQDWRDLLPRVTTPTLVMGCEGSHVSPDSQRYVSERIVGSRLRIFAQHEASSHFPFLENPAAFNASLAEFLELQDAA